jgi:hypothetical protein
MKTKIIIGLYSIFSILYDINSYLRWRKHYEENFVSSPLSELRRINNVNVKIIDLYMDGKEIPIEYWDSCCVVPLNIYVEEILVDFLNKTPKFSAPNEDILNDIIKTMPLEKRAKLWKNGVPDLIINENWKWAFRAMLWIQGPKSKKFIYNEIKKSIYSKNPLEYDFMMSELWRARYYWLLKSQL